LGKFQISDFEMSRKGFARLRWLQDKKILEIVPACLNAD